MRGDHTHTERQVGVWSGKLPKNDISLRFPVTLSGIAFSGITTYCNCQQITLLFHLLHSSVWDKNSSGRLNSKNQRGSRLGKRSTDEIGAKSLIHYLSVYCWVFPYPYRHWHCIYVLLPSHRFIIGEAEDGEAVGEELCFLKGCCVFAWHPL